MEVALEVGDRSSRSSDDFAGRGLVPRHELFERLSAAGPGSVTLVCAPAGSGKSALVRSWVDAAEHGARTAWISVERGETDAQRFWLSVVDAIADVVDDDERVERVTPSPSFRVAPLVERLLAELAELRHPVVVVIDDLHELDSAEALDGLELFLRRLPEQARVVISTREEPDLGLHRLRLEQRLTEVHGRDLRFTLEETKRLLQEASVAMSADSAAVLHERTEGWPAGLRLAALSLAGHPDPERFAEEFSGSERTVAGYLLAEVLQRQPEDVRDLLLRTSVLDRVSGPLADALTGATGSEAILHRLEAANAFVVPLDVGRSWFRYHHLFSDLLQLELRRSSPTLVDSLHRTAAQWLEEHGEPVDAIRHAQAARDWAHAARVLADNSVSLVLDGRRPTVHALLGAFPPGACEADAELALVFATAALYDHLVEDSDTYLAVANRLAAAVPDERKRLFALRLASALLWLACQRGDLAAATKAMQSLEAQTGAELARVNDHRAAALLNLGIAELWALRVDDARRDLEAGLALARRIDRPFLQVACIGYLALAAVLGPSPPVTALALSDQAAELAAANGWSGYRILVPAVAAAVTVAAWLGRFEEGERWLDRVDGDQRPTEELETEPELHFARAFLRLGQGRPGDALADFRAAARTDAAAAREGPLPMDLGGWTVFAQALMGETEAARAALAAFDSDQRAWAGAVLAAGLLDLLDDRPADAVEEVAPLIDGEPPALQPRWATIQALLVDAAARDRLDGARRAEASIEQALDLAERDGVILPFALAPVRSLLERHPRDRTAHAALLTSILDVLAGSAPRATADPTLLPEQLSEAELRVMRFLPSNLKAPEIAAELFVSANTVRTHMRHIYAKLDAHSRGEAVERARQLGLLAPARRP
jgi:LuxR family maltose regulon positive regulatory protein